MFMHAEGVWENMGLFNGSRVLPECIYQIYYRYIFGTVRF